MSACKHEYVWPDGCCCRCGVLATVFPGKSDAHVMVPRGERMPKSRWEELFGAEAIKSGNLSVMPCGCDEAGCHGWQVVFPGQQPSLPVLSRVVA